MINNYCLLVSIKSIFDWIWFEPRSCYKPWCNLIVWMKRFLKRIVCSDWHFKHSERNSSDALVKWQLDSEDDFFSGCWNISHYQQSFSRLLSSRHAIKFHRGNLVIIVIIVKSSTLIGRFHGQLFGRQYPSILMLCALSKNQVHQTT